MYFYQDPDRNYWRRNVCDISVLVLFGVQFDMCVFFGFVFCFLASDQKPDVLYSDIGGMDIQKQEVREAVELPLTHFELYKQVPAHT